MENPNTWDEHDKAMMAILDANRESEQQGVIGLSLHRKLGDYVRAALAEAKARQECDTLIIDWAQPRITELRAQRDELKQQVTQQAATISRYESALENLSAIIDHKEDFVYAASSDPIVQCRHIINTALARTRTEEPKP